VLITLDKDRDTLSKEVSNRIAILSSNDSLQRGLAESLRVHGFTDLQFQQQNILYLTTLTDADKLSGVVIDIECNTDVTAILLALSRLVPRQCWVILTGSSDSIQVAQRFLEQGVYYFHVDLQFEQLIHKIVSEPTPIKDRAPLAIRVIGCKGGVGASVFTCKLALAMNKIKPLPILLQQGDRGTKDIDIILGCDISKGIQPISGLLDVLSIEGSNIDFDDKETQETIVVTNTDKYNFMLLDQAVHNVGKEQMIADIEATDCAILLLDDNTASLRVATHYIDLFNKAKNHSNKCKRLFVVVNNLRGSSKANSLQTSDIERVLGRKVDFTVPYCSNGLGNIKSKVQSKADKVIKSVAYAILGIEEKCSKNLLSAMKGILTK
jgi:pilus assembly protein CpaE